MMFKNAIRFSCYFLVLQLLVVKFAWAQGKPVLYQGEKINLSQYVSVYSNPNPNISFDSIVQGKEFVFSKNQILGLDLTNNFYWLKFDLINNSDFDHLLLELDYPTLRYCEFYFPDSLDNYHSIVYSDTLNFFNRKYKHQNFIFDVYPIKNKVSTYFLKISSTEQIVLPLTIGSAQTISESLLTKDLLWGIFVGILLVMIFYNLFIYISTKDVSYLYYVNYILFIGLAQTSLSGYTYRFLFTHSPQLFHYGLIIFPALAGVFAILFIKKFLHTKESLPKGDVLLNIGIALYSSAIFLRILGFDLVSYRMIDISALFGTITSYVISIIRFRSGYRPAKFFLVAWSMFMAGLVFFVLRNLGVLPVNDFTNYTMQLGVILEVTLLSIALADKFNILKIEKEQSQLEALNAIKENEKIVREQNFMLEQKVAERTTELIATNDDLKQTLAELKQTQSQLVESEKMASLGQLTAGIAHEINNPINFVTSNVTPLKRDVKMVFETIDFIESLSYTELPAEEKKQKIATFKEELDYDYLKIEIDHLLNGIYEGSSRTAEIVKGLRIFSRVDENDLKKANIHEGLDSTLVIINNQLNGTIKIAKEYTASLPVIECYPGKLNQVFLNIITNAIHAVRTRHKESGNGLITIKTAAQADTITVEIRDNGIGMDEQTQKKIYEPFFTTKDVGEGTGLGMSIVYNTVKKHNGTIQLVSRLGEGTSFLITLPKIVNQ